MNWSNVKYFKFAIITGQYKLFICLHASLCVLPYKISIQIEIKLNI